MALFAAYLATAGAPTLQRAALSLADAARHLGEDPLTARRRVFGAPYADAVEAIRRALPRDASYLLVNADPRDEGAPMWVRFDLAPRRALFLGHLDDLPRTESLRKGLPRGPQKVVLTYGPASPPRLMDRQSFLNELDTVPRSHEKRREPQGR